MKLPTMDELLRIIAAVGAALLVVTSAVMFFMWVCVSASFAKGALTHLQRDHGVTFRVFARRSSVQVWGCGGRFPSG